MPSLWQPTRFLWASAVLFPRNKRGGPLALKISKYKLTVWYRRTGDEKSKTRSWFATQGEQSILYRLIFALRVVVLTPSNWAARIWFPPVFTKAEVMRPISNLCTTSVNLNCVRAGGSDGIVSDSTLFNVLRTTVRNSRNVASNASSRRSFEAAVMLFDDAPSFEGSVCTLSVSICFSEDPT